MGRSIKARESYLKEARVQRKSRGGGLSTAAPKNQNEDVCIYIFLDGVEQSVGDTDNAEFKRALRKYSLIFQWPFQQLPDRLEQCGCDTEMKIGLVTTDPP